MSSSTFQDPKERTDFLIAIAVVALFGIFMGYYMWSDYAGKEQTLEQVLDDENVTASMEPVLVTETPKVDAPRPTGSTSEVHHNTNEASYSSPIIYSDSSVVEDLPTALDSVALSLPTEPLAIDSVAAIINEKTQDITAGSSISSKKGTTTIKKDAETSAATAPSDYSTSTEVVKNIVDGKDCRIIIGSYRLKSSRDKMLEQLAKTNYQVVTYREKGLNIVAIHHSCEKDALRSTVKAIREKFAKGAFITAK